jgi:hypothetical protein
MVNSSWLITTDATAPHPNVNSPPPPPPSQRGHFVKSGRAHFLVAVSTVSLHLIVIRPAYGRSGEFFPPGTWAVARSTRMLPGWLVVVWLWRQTTFATTQDTITPSKKKHLILAARFQARRSRNEGKRDKEEEVFFFFFSIRLSLTSSVDRYWVTTGSTTTDWADQTGSISRDPRFIFIFYLILPFKICAKRLASLSS